MITQQPQAPFAIRPLQWAALPELYDTPPLDAADLACMVELQAVLARHGKLGRFALHLAHRHFDLKAGEVLIERSDPDSRAQTVTVGRLDQVGEAVPTTWLLDASPDLLASGAAIYCVCVVDAAKTDACSRHGKSSGPGEGALKEETAKQQRIAEEKAGYERGGPVAGHDFEKERQEDNER